MSIMYKVFWRLDGDQCDAIVDTSEEAEQLCNNLTNDGCYTEIYFEYYDDEADIKIID